MLHISKWAEGRPLFLATFAQTIAAFSNSSAAFFQANIAGDFPHEVFPVVSLNDWLNLYKNHRKVWASMKHFFEPEDVELSALNWVENLNRAENSAVDYDTFFANTQPFFDNYYHQNLDQIQTDINAKKSPNSSRSTDQDIVKLTDNPALNFLLKVWAPCYFLYGTTPPLLLRKARLGNKQAIDRLLRLDKSAIFDFKISRQFHAAASLQSRHFDMFIDGLKKPPKGSISSRKVKVSMAAFICCFFEAADYKLEEPEIRALFDAVAKDYGYGDIDTDIPDGSDAFSRAIRRELPVWRMALKSDKK